MNQHGRSRHGRSRLSVLVGTCFLAITVLAGCAGLPGGQSGGQSGESTDNPSSEALVGTWVLDETFSGRAQPFLTIVSDGTWTASDGCNVVQGTWKLGEGGALTTTAGPHTLIYCEGKPIPSLFSEAKTVTVDGDTLVLMDVSGDVTATLISGREPLTPLNSPSSND